MKLRENLAKYLTQGITNLAHVGNEQEAFDALKKGQVHSGLFCIFPAHGPVLPEIRSFLIEIRSFFPEIRPFLLEVQLFLLEI